MTLVVPLTSTLGREEEIQLLVDTVPTSPVTTVVGAGGVGKTRLVSVAVLDLADQFRGGVHTVWLADVRDPGLLLAEVGSAVGQPRSGGIGLAGLIKWLQGRETLLVLDNAEHLLDAVAELAVALVEQVPSLRLIISSREPLLIAGETVLSLRPLPVPAAGSGPDTLAASPVVRMFIDRARSRDRTFDPDPVACEEIAAVCRRLDGLPLAIELAAARAAVLGLPRLVERLLGPGGTVLSGSGRSTPPRQSSLRAVFEWSEGLLEESERRLLRRLSVFAGGFTIGDVEGVLARSTDGLETADELDVQLAALVDKSLVERDHHTNRYALLETIREFASRRLVEFGEWSTYQDSHARWYQDLAMQVGAGVSSGPERPWLERLGPEQDNLRLALRRIIDSSDPTPALAVAAGLPLFWWARGQHREGFTWLREALERAPGSPAELQAAALFGMAFLWAHDTDDWNAAAVYLDRAIALLDGEPPILGYLFCLRGEAHAYNAAHDEALAVTRRGLAILESAGDPWGLAFAVWNVGFALQTAGRPDEAHEHYARMATIQEQHGSRLELMIAANSLGELSELAGDFAQARDLYAQGLSMRLDLGASRLGYVHGSLPRSLLALARCDVALGDLDSARDLIAEATPLAREMRDRVAEDQCVTLAETTSSGPLTGRFVREGEGWRVAFGAETGFVANTKGMRHLVVLLSRPHVPMAALTLTGLPHGGAAPDSDAGPLLDDAALRAYRLRLQALDQDTDAADAAGDAERSESLDQERSAVLAELSRATGLGGRARRAGSTAERARLNATRTMRDAITRIGEQCPGLAAHLTTALHTGHRCSYEPAPLVAWQT